MKISPRMLIFLLSTPDDEYWLFERSVDWYQAHFGEGYKMWFEQERER